MGEGGVLSRGRGRFGQEDKLYSGHAHDVFIDITLADKTTSVTRITSQTVT